MALDDSFQRLVDDAVFLKRYYIESRYPDDLPEDVRPEEVSEALAAASHLHDFVLARTPMH
jgi:HEPN domain-containing protein